MRCDSLSFVHAHIVLHSLSAFFHIWRVLAFRSVDAFDLSEATDMLPHDGGADPQNLLTEFVGRVINKVLEQVRDLLAPPELRSAVEEGNTFVNHGL